MVVVERLNIYKQHFGESENDCYREVTVAERCQTIRGSATVHFS